MFDKTAVSEYRSITAPDDLKLEIFRSVETHTHKPVRTISVIGAIAACFVLLCLFGVNTFTNNTVNIDMIPSAAMMSYTGPAARSSETYAVVSLKADGLITIRTSDCFYIDNSEQLTPIHTCHRALRQLVLYWPIQAGSASFKANGVSYTLIADSESGNVTIVQD